MSTSTEPEFATLTEASMIARTPVQSLRRWIAEGRLAAFRPGRLVLVRRRDLANLIESSRLGD